MVHYQRTGDEAKALEMIALLEESWLVQVDSLGFTAPLDDQGACGPDGRYDVFIWPGIDGAFVSGINTNPATPHADWTTYMAIDVSGATGEVLLEIVPTGSELIVEAKLDPKDIADIVTACDRDGDGQLDWAEVVAAMKH